VRRREFVGLLGGAAAALWSLAARAQKPERGWRVGVLMAGSPPNLFVSVLQNSLRDLGYIEGQNVSFEVRFARDRSELATEYAAELVRLKPDVIVTHFTPAAVAAKAATSTIPIVMAPAGAPVETGLVTSLARPGSNVTGLSSMAAEFGGKRLELLRQMVPSLSRVAVLALSTNPFTRPFLSDMDTAAASAGVRLDPILVASAADFENAFAVMVRAHTQAVIVQPFFDAQRVSIVELAAKHGLPTMFSDREAVVSGGLMSFWADQSEFFKRAAVFVDKILKGAKPEDLPVEQPAKFELVVNVKTAKDLGLTVPPSILARADEVIE
jgi:putative tryptophan/tyrosine transport system substrate-binding protein